jgi:hypothetical protein
MGDGREGIDEGSRNNEVMEDVRCEGRFLLDFQLSRDNCQLKQLNAGS